MDELEPVNFSLAFSNLPEDVVVILALGEEEHDLTRDGGFVFEPYDFVLEGVISFVPVWMADDENTVPPAVSLVNYPNPFFAGSSRSEGVNIAYSLPQPANVILSIYNIRGQKVSELVNDSQQAGSYQITWNLLDHGNKPAASGVYFTRLQAGQEERYSKIVLIK
jgi:hypothetical protein